MFLYYKLSDTFNYTSNGDPNSNIHSSNDILSYTTQRPQTNNLSSSSHQNQNSERHDQYNTNHSNSSRKSTTRASKKRKQLQQQETIRTELIPGHRGDRDVDELVMFIDGNSSSKQRQNSAPLRLTDTNSSTSRRKSRKSVKETFINTNNEDIQSISFIDEEDQTTLSHSTDNTSQEQNLTEISLPNDDESHSSPNTTNGEISAPEWLEPIRSTSPINNDNDSFSLSTATLNDSNSEIISEPFVTVTHRRRLTKERRQDSNPSLPLTSRTSHHPSSYTNDKRRFPPVSQPSSSSSSLQNGTTRSTMRNGLSNIKPSNSVLTKEESITLPIQSVSQASIPPTSSSVSNTLTEQLSPRLSSHSSSSSLSSLKKRQSKPPPVVFLNKSEDVELNDVSFGFDVENSVVDAPVTQSLSSSSPPLPTPSLSSENEKEPEHFSSTQPNDPLNDSKSSSSRRSYQQQRWNREKFFYPDSDIHSHQHNNRNYPSQTIPITQSSYIDPLLLLQMNQHRLAANYSQSFAYMNLLRTPYMPSQTPYVLIPTTFTTGKSNDTIDQDEKTLDDNNTDETSQPSEHIQEPLVVYTTIPAQLAPVYMQSTRKESNDLEQPISIPPFYSSQQYYSTQVPYAAYFQPITPASLLIESKSHQDDTDDDTDDHDYERSTKLYHQTRQQSSSHIMSNALQLVYSQERRNAQTDRFNLDQLTAYLAMKWTNAVDHYEQGDDEILLTDEQ